MVSGPNLYYVRMLTQMCIVLDLEPPAARPPPAPVQVRRGTVLMPLDQVDCRALETAALAHVCIVPRVHRLRHALCMWRSLREQCEYLDKSNRTNMHVANDSEL